MSRGHLGIGQKIDVTKLEQAKAMRRNMTPAKRGLWSELRRNRLDGFHFRRQQIVDGFIVDFYCHAAGLVVEVDGPAHSEQAAYDAGRDRVLADRGLQILRFRNEEVMNDLNDVLQRILAACHAGVNLTPQFPSLQRKGEQNSPLRHGEGPGEGSR